jgi:hypothetical protein
MPAVTQIRASDDHVPGDGNYHMQWQLGYSSLFAWAIALAPFKDNFYSTSVQPGGSVGNNVETSPALQVRGAPRQAGRHAATFCTTSPSLLPPPPSALRVQAAISLYSAGPVTPGDGVGYADAALILRTCNTDGLLLSPSRAATAIDAQIVARLFPGAGPVGQVYATYTSLSGWTWGHVLAAALSQPYTFTPADLGSVTADVAINALGLRAVMDASAVSAPAVLSTVAYALNATTFDPATLVVSPFDGGHPIPLAACGEVDFQLWHTAPVFANGWALLGELTKFTPVSTGRVKQVQVAGGSVVVDVYGQAGEAVPLTFYNTATTNTTTLACVLDVAGRATAIVPAGTCA